MDVSFVQIFLVIGCEFFNPFTFIAAAYTVRWVAHHYHYGGITLYTIGFVGFGTEPVGKECSGVGMAFFEAVGEVDSEALLAGWFVACLGHEQVHLQVCHGIRGHEQFESIEAGQQVCFDIVAPDALLAFEAFVDLFYDFSQEGSGAGGGVEDLYAVDFLLDQFALLVDFDLGFGGVGQSLREVEIGLEDVVDGPDDEVDYGAGVCTRRHGPCVVWGRIRSGRFRRNG